MISVLRQPLSLLMGLTILCCWALSGCATSSAAAIPSPEAASPTQAAADPAQGKTIFRGQAVIDGFIACQTCHPADPALPNGVGPNLAGVALRGATRVPGLSAAEYISHSIRVHDEYVVPGFSPGIAKALVGRDFGEILSDQQVDHLVAYLLTLEEPALAAAAVATPSAEPAPSVQPCPTPNTIDTPSPSQQPSPSPIVTASPSRTPSSSPLFNNMRQKRR